MNTSLKRAIGRGLIRLADAVPALKPRLRPWGLRTSKEWFGERIVRVQMPDRRSFNLASVSGNYLSFELFWRGAGYYEPITNLVLASLLEDGDTLFDIGANIGFFTLAAALHRPGLRIVAFEPNPRIHELLRRNVEANALDHVQCEPLALSDAQRLALLYLSASDMSASLESRFDEHSAGCVKIQTSTLDHYLELHPVPGQLILKVDVEGHEEAFFRGARRTLTRLQPDVITEVTLDPQEETVSFLAQAGYRFYQITDEGLLETSVPQPFVRDQFVFLNNLLSARPPADIAALFDRIRPRVRAIDLTQTSKHLDPEAVRRFVARQKSVRAAVPLAPSAAP
jgi:FkbM family methyltransferase